MSEEYVFVLNNSLRMVTQVTTSEIVMRYEEYNSCTNESYVISVVKWERFVGDL